MTGKKIIFVWSFLFSLCRANAENDSGSVFLSALKHRSMHYVELGEKSGIVFQLHRLGGPFLGYRLSFTDTIFRQADSSAYLFAGKRTAIQMANDRMYLVIRDTVRNKIKRIQVDTSGYSAEANAKINNAYWWTNFFRLLNDFRAGFILPDFGYWEGDGLWESFGEKRDTYFRYFIPVANARIQALRDSFTAQEKPNTRITRYLIDNIASLDYNTLKDSLTKLPSEYPYKSEYFNAVIDSVCARRPDLFFRLAEDLPDQRDVIFASADNRREIRKKLKEVAPDSPLKKEFLKGKRREKFYNIAGTTGILLVDALIIYGLVILIT